MLPADGVSSSSSTTTTASTKKTKEVKKDPPPEAPDVSAPPDEAAPVRSDARVLEEDAPAPSNPTGSRELTRRQAGVAEELTGPSRFRRMDEIRLESGVPPVDQPPADPELDHLVDDPTVTEQRSDLRLKPPFQPNGELPEIPDFSSLTPTSRTTLYPQKPGLSDFGPRTDGRARKTYEQDGVTYEVTREPGGTVTTSFTRDGVSYSNIAYQDGTSKTSLFSDVGEDVRYSREVLTNADGEVTDKGRVITTHEGQDGTFSSQSRTVTVQANGDRLTEEMVSRPDGGKAEFSRVDRANGTSSEGYSYVGEDGSTLTRSTRTDIDGSSRTRQEKTYTSPLDLEELIEAPETVPPPGATGFAYLPEGGRGETEVREVDVFTTDASGHREVLLDEETYAQSSSDISVSLDGLVGVGPPDGSITRSVTHREERNEDGELEESTSVDQLVEFEAKVRGGDSLRIARGDSWSTTGEYSNFFEAEGLPDRNLDNLLNDPNSGTVDVEGALTSIFPSDVKAGFLLGRKDEASEWLGVDHDHPEVNYRRDAAYDKDGKLIAETSTFGELDPSQDGRSVTVVETEDSPRVWTYSNVSNEGQDFKRQTVVEGTEISTLEQRSTLGPGEFTYSSVTTDGNDVTNSNSSSRLELTRAELEAAVADESFLTPEVRTLLLSGPGPYFVERTDAFADHLERDGEVIQPASESSSYRFDVGRGREASRYFEQYEDDNGDDHSSSFLSSTDPRREPPIVGKIQTQEPDGSGGSRWETGELTIDRQGRVLADGELLGEFGGAPLTPEFLSQQNSTSNLIGALLKGARGVAGSGVKASNPDSTRYRAFDVTTKTGFQNAFKLVDALGAAWGTKQLFEGLSDGDYRQVATGAGFITQGLAAPQSSLYAKLQGAKFRGAGGLKLAAKGLGAAGGFVSLGLGGYDLFNGETTRDKVAGGLSAAAGGVAVATAFIPGVGWVTGGLLSGALSLASVIVGWEDTTKTVPLDNEHLS